MNFDKKIAEGLSSMSPKSPSKYSRADENTWKFLCNFKKETLANLKAKLILFNKN